jgi:transcriptional regulator with XRE-family HTH domain
MSTTAVPSIPRTVGGRLLYYRENAGLKREQAAIHVGRSAVTVRDWELDERIPRYVLLVQLANLYGVPVTALIGGTEEPSR